MTISIKSAAKAPMLDPIDRIIVHEIKLLRLFFERRSLAMRELFAEQVVPSYMRDELVREVTLCFMQGQPLRMSTCQRLLERFGPPTLFKQELSLLKRSDLVFLEKDLSNSQETLIRPTEKLVSFYRFQLPRLEADVRDILNVQRLNLRTEERKLTTEGR